MALATLDRTPRVARVVPAALTPVVVLVLQLHPTDLVDLLVDELLVTRGAELWALEQRALEALHVVARVGADEEVAHRARDWRVNQLEQVPLRWRDDIRRVSLDVRLLNRVAGDTGHAFPIAALLRQVADEDVLRAREEGHGIVTAAAVTCG